MDADIDIEIDNPHETRDRFIKLLASTAVGFLATKLTENTIEKILESRRNR
jgi:hypothetical protein